MRGTIRVSISVVALAWWATAAFAQTVPLTRNVDLRPDPSLEYPPSRRVTPSEPPLTLLEPTPEDGYYHVKTSTGEVGYVSSSDVKITATPWASRAPIPPGPGIP